jgi:hypothetical protein
MAFMRFQELPGFIAELSHVHAGDDLRQVNRIFRSEFVLEIGVDDFLLAFFDQLHQRPQFPARGF